MVCWALTRFFSLLLPPEREWPVRLHAGHDHNKLFKFVSCKCEWAFLWVDHFSFTSEFVWLCADFDALSTRRHPALTSLQTSFFLFSPVSVFHDVSLRKQLSLWAESFSTHTNWFAPQSALAWVNLRQLHLYAVSTSSYVSLFLSSLWFHLRLWRRLTHEEFDPNTDRESNLSWANLFGALCRERIDEWGSLN